MLTGIVCLGSSVCVCAYAGVSVSAKNIRTKYVLTAKRVTNIRGPDYNEI